jgi:hypothetical protein
MNSVGSHIDNVQRSLTRTATVLWIALGIRRQGRIIMSLFGFSVHLGRIQLCQLIEIVLSKLRRRVGKSGNAFRVIGSIVEIDVGFASFFRMNSADVGLALRADGVACLGVYFLGGGVAFIDDGMFLVMLVLYGTFSVAFGEAFS